jgi:hypothetical protein
LSPIEQKRPLFESGLFDVSGDLSRRRERAARCAHQSDL